MKRIALCAALLLCAASAPAQQRYEDLPTSAGVGKWQPAHKAQSYKITVDGQDIFVNGVLQKARFDPDQDIAIQNGEAVLVPRGQGLTLKARTVEAGPLDPRPLDPRPEPPKP